MEAPLNVTCFICFIESEGRAVPHMHPLEARNAYEARAENLTLMRDHSHATRAQIYWGSQAIETVTPTKRKDDENDHTRDQRQGDVHPCRPGRPES